MADYLFEIAKKFQDKINSDVNFAANFPNTYKENFVSEIKIPERLSETNLKNLNNIYDISERKQNWNSDLDGSKWKSLYESQRNRLSYEDYPDQLAFEKAKRANDLASFERSEQEYQIQKQLDQQKILQNEDEISQLTFNRLYEKLKASIPNYALLPPGERYKIIRNKAQAENADPAIFARIDNDFITQNEEMINNIKSYSRIQKQLLRYTTAPDPETNPIGYQNYSSLKTLGMYYEQSVDPDIVKALVSSGGLNTIDAARILNPSSVQENSGRDFAEPPITDEGIKPDSSDQETASEQQSPVPQINTEQASTTNTTNTNVTNQRVMIPKPDLLNNQSVVNELRNIDDDIPIGVLGVMFKTMYDPATIDQDMNDMSEIVNHILNQPEEYVSGEIRDLIWEKYSKLEEFKKSLSNE